MAKMYHLRVKIHTCLRRFRRQVTPPLRIEIQLAKITLRSTSIFVHPSRPFLPSHVLKSVLEHFMNAIT